MMGAAMFKRHRFVWLSGHCTSGVIYYIVSHHVDLCSPSVSHLVHVYAGVRRSPCY